MWRRTWIERIVGIAIGIVLGLGVVAIFVFVFSEDAIDSGSLGGQSARNEPARSGHEKRPHKPQQPSRGR